MDCDDIVAKREEAPSENSLTQGARSIILE